MYRLKTQLTYPVEVLRQQYPIDLVPSLYYGSSLLIVEVLLAVSGKAYHTGPVLVAQVCAKTSNVILCEELIITC